jgi:hypothetical protein
MVAAWAVAHDAVDQLLPMSRMTLKALTQELIMVEAQQEPSRTSVQRSRIVTRPTVIRIPWASTDCTAA